MRYEVQIWLMGRWQVMGYHGSLRLAGLQQAQLAGAWAEFAPTVRIWDTEEKRAVDAV